MNLGRSLCLKPAMILAFLSSLCLSAQAVQDNHVKGFEIEGTVRDQSGGAVPHAEVVINSRSFKVVTSTDIDGRFALHGVPVKAATLVVRAKGFTMLERKWEAQNVGSTYLEFVLAPEPVVEHMTVTADRTEEPLRDTAARVSVLTPERLSATAALTVDDMLRQVPGFALFRRSGSLTANPTSQGVSLRGVGASGASRVLVLEDGIPLNDPFGGWVYWDRVPRASIGSMEVLEGGASALYGTDALGGVINIIPRKAQSSSLRLETSYGNGRVVALSPWTVLRKGRWTGAFSGEGLRTDGYILVDQRERGRVDRPADSRHLTGEVTLGRALSQQAHLFLRAAYFRESRNNGTPLQRNSTHLRQLAFGGDWQSQKAGIFSFRAYGGPQVFDQHFSAIARDRNTESLTQSQRVPAQQTGISAQWSRTIGLKQTLVAGFEGYEVRGSSNELGFSSGALASAAGSGGRQRAGGVFGEDIVRLAPRWVLTAGVRFDRWRNYDALSATRPLSRPGPIAVTVFPNRKEQAFNPRLSVLHQVTEKLSLGASAYRAFRAPSLNELYRSFRVGNIVTRANDALRAERLGGGEAGATYSAFDGKLVTRGTVFWNKITRPIANVTLSVAPNLITRQRQNLGSTRSRGADFDVDARISNTVTLSGGYQFADSTVSSFPAERSLEGFLIPHVPRHEVTFQFRYANPLRLTVGVQGRIVGMEFEDDQNQLRLNRFFTLDALASRSLGHGVEAFVAAENLFNQRYDVGRTPVRILGPPLLARVGLRVEIH